MFGSVRLKYVNLYHEAKGIQPAASGLSPQCVMCDRPVSQPAVDWPTPGLVHNTSSLIALVSLQGASAYTTSGRWQGGLLVSGSIPDVPIVILLFNILLPGVTAWWGIWFDGAMRNLKTIIVLVSGSPPRHSRHDRETSLRKGVFFVLWHLFPVRCVV